MIYNFFFFTYGGHKKRTRGGEGDEARAWDADASWALGAFFFSLFFHYTNHYLQADIWQLWQLLPYHPTTMMMMNGPGAWDASASQALGAFFFSYLFFFFPLYQSLFTSIYGIYGSYCHTTQPPWWRWRMATSTVIITITIPLLQYIFNYFTIVSHY